MYEDRTLRQTVHLSVAGETLRVRFTDEFGTAPLAIGEAHAALPAADGATTAIDSATDRTLSFDGSPRDHPPAGHTTLERPGRAAHGPGRRPRRQPVPAAAHTPADTVHSSAYQHNHVTGGDATGQPDITPTSTTRSWHFLSGAAVERGNGTADSALVTLDGSITDGERTETDAGHRWPHFLAERLRGDRRLAGTGVVNAAVGGNCLLRDCHPIPGSPAEFFVVYCGLTSRV